MKQEGSTAARAQPIRSMIGAHPRSRFETMLESADVLLDGGRPWDIQVHDQRLFNRVLAHGSLGLGEAYMDGWWDCVALDQLFFRLLKANLDTRVHTLDAAWSACLARLRNNQTVHRSREVGKKHYDIGNDLYRAMLDSRMNYSCGYWLNATDLEMAQEQKLDLICRKLMLAPGERLLDIGCGWGALAQFAAERYGVRVVGVTISEAQARLARDICRGWPVEIRLQDYRDLAEPFDKVVSVGMFEHVGYKNYRTYMEVVDRCLDDNGLFLLHTIGGNRSVKSSDPWIERYIFPNGMLPSPRQLARAIEGRFMIEDWHNFGPDYDLTLLAWHHNFVEAWPQLKHRYGQRFQRMWRYYLLTCAASFRARHNQLWQVVLSKSGARVGYRAPR